MTKESSLELENLLKKLSEMKNNKTELSEESKNHMRVLFEIENLKFFLSERLHKKNYMQWLHLADKIILSCAFAIVRSLNNEGFEVARELYKSKSDEMLKFLDFANEQISKDNDIEN